MLSDSIWRPERFFWLGCNYAVVWQEDLWNHLLRFATLQNGLEVLNIEDFRLWRFCEGAKGVLSKHSTSLLDSTDSVLSPSLYPMLRCSVQAGIGVRTSSSCLDCHILPPSHVSQLNANRLYSLLDCCPSWIPDFDPLVAYVFGPWATASSVFTSVCFPKEDPQSHKTAMAMACSSDLTGGLPTHAKRDWKSLNF